MASIRPLPVLSDLAFNASAVAIASATVAADTQNEAAACIFTQEEDATITGVHFRNASKTGTVANDVYTIGIQGVTTAGIPDGTYLGGGSPASRTFPNATYPQAGFGSNTGHWIDLANSIALQAGTDYALVVQRSGATDASNFLTLTYGDSSFALFAKPYGASATSTPTWTRQAGIPLYWGLRSASAVYLWPAGSALTTSATFGTTTEVGFTFTVPSAFGASNTIGLRRVALNVGSTAIAAGGTVTCTLYSGPTAASPTILQQALTLDSDRFLNTASRLTEFIFPEDTMAALVPGTKYGVGFSHSAAASGSVQYRTLTEAADAAAYPFGGFIYASRTLTDYPPSGNDTNAFTETTTRILSATLTFADFTAAAGGGGGSNRVYGS